MAHEACVLCTKTTDDVPNLGRKLTYKDVTAHHYCLLLSTELKQNGYSNEGILGYLRYDIKKEMKRTNQTKCYICRGKGASIRCSKKSCNLSFHLTCGLEAGCQNQFSGQFRSYCEIHIKIDKPTYIHNSKQECVICYDEMGSYNPINSIQSPCCSKESWYHKKCLVKYVNNTTGKWTKCPLCNNSDLFCKTIKNSGIYISEKTPEWQYYDSFYDSLEQFQERPTCSAKTCLCWRGRTYEPMTSGRKYSFLYCQYCGAKAIHRNCLGEEEFTCDDCQINYNDVGSQDENDTFGSAVEHGVQSNRNQDKNSAEFNIRPFAVVLRRLRSSELPSR